ncbi:MAG: hypothetical protein LLG05_18745 [Porphyromonadaceae bacterium]|nr:hypothetical protein [Porphyromonadaceae bacterium]
MITHAAIIFRDKVYKGRWHIEPLTEIRIKFANCNEETCDEQTRLDIVRAKQGFLTDTGEFLNRKEALKHVLECGQAYYPEGHEWNELFSEHIFPPNSFK